MAEPHIDAHKHSTCHQVEILASEVCGCFYCLANFRPTEILDWVEEPPDVTDGVSPIGETALCPKCGIDSVIGTASGYPVTKEFLTRMKEHWF